MKKKLMLYKLERLTVTLDVFKCYFFCIYMVLNFWLTVTLDVFKSRRINTIKHIYWGLTVTLDVFKYRSTRTVWITITD